MNEYLTKNNDEENQYSVSLTENSIKQNPIIQKIYKAFGIILIVVGIIYGIFVSSQALFGVSGASKNRFLGYFIQLIALFIITCGLSFLGLMLGGFLNKDRKKQFFVSLIIFGITYIIILSLYLIMFYLHADQMLEFTNVPTGYWQLSTGSTIAYYEFVENLTQEYPFILLHGGPGSPMSEKYYFVDSLLSKGYKVYQYDQLGCGKSSRLKDCRKYTLQRQIDDLDEIRKTIGAEKINLISFSFGGTLASNYIAKHPTNVDNSIFISPADIWNGDKSYPKLTKNGSKDQMKVLFKNFHYLMCQALTMVFYPMGLFVLMDEKDVDNLFIKFHDGLNMMPGSGKFYNHPGSGYGFWDNVMTGRDANLVESPYDELKKFTGKSLVVKTEFDYISFDVTVRFRDFIPNSTLITVNGPGHSVMPEYEQEIWDNIEIFIENGTTINKPYYGNDSPWN